MSASTIHAQAPFLRADSVRAATARTPFTALLAAATLVAAVAGRTLWHPLTDQPALRDHVAFGLPAFRQGRWWSTFTGLFFALQPGQYVLMLAGLLLLGGCAEVRLGTRRAALATISCHLVGVIGAAGFLALTAGHDWDWADDVSRALDAGCSAGFLGAAAAASATLTRPWRGRVQFTLATFALVLALYVGTIADVEHLFAVGFGLTVGPLLIGRRPRPRTRRLTRRDYRLLATAFMVLGAVAALISWFAPVAGPLASTLAPSVREQARVASHGLPSWALAQVAGYLWLARHVHRGSRRAWHWALGVTALTSLVLALSAVGLAIQHVAGWPAIVYQAIVNAAGLAVLVAGRRAFRNPSSRRARRTAGRLLASPGGADRAAAVAMARAQGTANRLAWMTTWPENNWFVEPGVDGYVAYQVHAGVAVGLCDPVASSAALRSSLLTAFAERSHREGLLPCLFTVTAEAAEHARALRWQALQVAEEAVVDLAELEFRGRSWQDVRTALNQATREGVEFRFGPLAEQPRGIQVQVRAISTAWVQDRGLPEMGFTLGGVDEALDPLVRVGLAVDKDNTVHGVTSWMPVYQKGRATPVGWTLDVMRRSPDGLRSSMEFLIASTCLTARDQGCQFVSLSGAPLARADDTGATLDRVGLDTFLDRLGMTLEPYYGFRSLHAFKSKFKPRFVPLYLVFPDAAALPRIGAALTRAYLPDARIRDLVSLARSRR